MFTLDPIIASLIGDYILQSHWQATEKVKTSLACAVHAVLYGLPFLIPYLDIHPSITAWLFIVSTHFIIDRWRLARFVVYAKNFLSPRRSLRLVQKPNTAEISGPDGFYNAWEYVDNWHPWKDCEKTGFHKDVPVWLSTWLLIIVDNLMHIILNALALRYL